MIRNAKPEDLTSIKRLIDSASKQGRVLNRSRQELESVLDDFFIYIEEGKVVGCVSLEIYSQKLAEIRSLVVDPKYQGKGIGSSGRFLLG